MRRFNKYTLLASSLLMLLWGGLLFAAVAGSVAWRYQIGTPPPPFGSKAIAAPAIGKDGTIYVTTNDSSSHLSAISPDGSLKWDQSLGSNQSSLIDAPAIGPDNTIYVCVWEINSNFITSLHAFSDSGTQKWVLRSRLSNCGELLIGSDGTIYTSGSDQNLFERNYIIYAINPNGTEKWVSQTDRDITLDALGADGTIYAHSLDINKNQASRESYVFAFSPIGTEKWRYKVNDISCGGDHSSDQPVALDDDGTIYARGTSDVGQGLLYALRPDGTQKWAFQPDNQIGPVGQLPVGSIVIGADRTIYVSGPYHLYALNPDGTQKWVSEMYTDSCSTPAIGNDGSIFAVGGGDGHVLYTINQAGGEMWNFRIPGYYPVHPTTPEISSDGMLYIPVTDGSLYAVNTNSGGLANSAWPMFKRDPQHTGSAPISKIIPNKGGNTGPVTVSIFGSILGTKGTTVKLTRNGQEAILGNPVAIQDEGRSIVTTFDLRGKSPGIYDVQVTQPDGSFITLASGFTVEVGGEPMFWVDIVGRSALRIDRPEHFFLVYGNSGSIDVQKASIWLQISPKEVKLSPNFPSTVKPPFSQISSEGALIYEGPTELMIPLSLYDIPPGSSGTLGFDLTLPKSGTFNIQTLTVAP